MVPTRARGDLSRESPACAAWTRFGGRADAIAGVDVLKEDDRSCVYRLVSRDPLEPNIIVKSTSRDRIVRESTAYERILPRLGILAPRYHGWTDGGDSGKSYLFVDEAGGEEYSPSASEHRIVAGEWLGRFHVGSASLAEEERHFERDPKYYRDHLRLASDTMLRHRSDSLLEDDDLQLFDTVVSQCAAVERNWAGLEDFCSRMPLCYVHGDFKADNVRLVRAAAGHGELVVYDWASMAMQVPALDLTQLFTRSFSKKPLNADIHAYSGIVRRKWPSMDVSRVRRLAYVGEVFRWAVAIRWAAEELRHGWGGQTAYLFKLYRVWMDDIIEAAPWEEASQARDRLSTIAI